MPCYGDRLKAQIEYNFIALLTNMSIDDDVRSRWLQLTSISLLFPIYSI